MSAMVNSIEGASEEDARDIERCTREVPYTPNFGRIFTAADLQNSTPSETPRTCRANNAPEPQPQPQPLPLPLNMPESSQAYNPIPTSIVINNCNPHIDNQNIQQQQHQQPFRNGVNSSNNTPESFQNSPNLSYTPMRMSSYQQTPTGVRQINLEPAHQASMYNVRTYSRQTIIPNQTTVIPILSSPINCSSNTITAPVPQYYVYQSQPVSTPSYSNSQMPQFNPPLVIPTPVRWRGRGRGAASQTNHDSRLHQASQDAQSVTITHNYSSAPPQNLQQVPAQRNKSTHPTNPVQRQYTPQINMQQLPRSHQYLQQLLGPQLQSEPPQQQAHSQSQLPQPQQQLPQSLPSALPRPQMQSQVPSQLPPQLPSQILSQVSSQVPAQAPLQVAPQASPQVAPRAPPQVVPQVSSQVTPQISSQVAPHAPPQQSQQQPQAQTPHEQQRSSSSAACMPVSVSSSTQPPAPKSVSIGVQASKPEMLNKACYFQGEPVEKVHKMLNATVDMQDESTQTDPKPEPPRKTYRDTASSPIRFPLIDVPVRRKVTAKRVCRETNSGRKLEEINNGSKDSDVEIDVDN